jgi:hypothetical protein
MMAGIETVDAAVERVDAEHAAPRFVRAAAPLVARE